jgi:hypothetical protein
MYVLREHFYKFSWGGSILADMESVSQTNGDGLPDSTSPDLSRNEVCEQLDELLVRQLELIQE